VIVPVDSRFAAATDAVACGRLVAEAFGKRLPGADWTAFAITRALPRKDGGFTLSFEVPLTGGRTLHLGGYLPDDAGSRPAWAGETEHTAWIADPGLAVAMPEGDPLLERARDISVAGWRQRLADRLGWPAPPPDPDPVLAYRLEKRLVLRWRSGRTDRPDVVLRLMRPRTLKRSAAAWEGGATIPGVTVPRILLLDPREGILAMEHLPGTTLEHGPQDTERAYAAAGAMLRAYHLPSTAGGAPWTAADELAQLKAWTGAAGVPFPELGAALARLTSTLEARIPDQPRFPVTLHRDFYDKQVLFHDGTAALLDLDTAAAGDPALDVENFLAHVTLRGLQDPGRLDELESAGRAFRLGYGTRLPGEGRLAWWRAASLGRLAILYVLRPRWRSITTTLLDEAETCLN
jgi:aminoglycoside phosphotransferase (APT) family kinase protein